MSIATKNRDASYKIELSNLYPKQRLVYDAIKAYEQLTKQELSDVLNMSINTVCGRISELLDFCLIKEIGSKENTLTDRDNTLYGIVPDDQVRDKINARWAELDDQRKKLVRDYQENLSTLTKDMVMKEIKKINKRIYILERL